MATAIRLENLSKSYKINRNLGHSTTLSETISQWTKNLVHPRKKISFKKTDLLWALQDVSLDIQQGEKVGILGSNGAGKSTLLKILTQISPPTSGKVSIKGRVASLLEVGTGFHSELTGRENVFLNGAILGMTHKEIRQKFDEIVAFAEVEKFIDTPVKRYSSGMVVRLAFSVAAHLDAEIILIDEVLAVGDTAFQHKCVKKMGEISDTGRTILFVSHNMNTISQLCDRGILLDHGKVISDDKIDKVINTYISPSRQIENLKDRVDRTGNGLAKAETIAFFDSNGRPTRTIELGKPFKIAVDLDVKPEAAQYTLAVQLAVTDVYDNALVSLGTDLLGPVFSPTGNQRRVRFIGEVPGGLPLLPATYNIYLAVYCNGRSDKVRRAASFDIVVSDYWESDQFPIPAAGPVLLKQKWQITESLH